MFLIFRVQDENGRGPYKPGFSKIWVENRKDMENLLPWFQEFGWVNKKVFFEKNAGSGCKTIEQLRRWFTKKEFSILKKYGYNAVKMEVDRIIAESNVQCFFDRTKQLKSDVEIIELY